MIWRIHIFYTGITKRRRRGFVYIEAPNADEARIMAVMWFKGEHPEMPRNRVRASGTVMTVAARDDRVVPSFQEYTPQNWIRPNRRWRRVTKETVITRKFDDKGEPLE